MLLLGFVSWFTVTVVQAARERSVIVGVLADRTVGQVVRDGVVGLVAQLPVLRRAVLLRSVDLGRATAAVALAVAWQR